VKAGSNARGVWKRLRPDRLAAQIALLVLVSIALFHVAVTLALNLLDGERGWRTAARWELAAGVVSAIDFAPVEDRAQLLAELSRASRGLRFSLRTDRPPTARNGSAAVGVEALRARLWKEADVFATIGANAVAVALRRGGYVTVALSPTPTFGPPPEGGPARGAGTRWFPGGPPPPGGAPPPGRPGGPPGPGFAPGSGSGPSQGGEPPVLPSLGAWFGSGLFFLICAAILTVWSSRAVVAPLVELARRAEKFPSESSERELLPEKGPLEVRELTRALNRMQDRIYSMIAARSRALAAISHDLRTIITRMRLRAEFIEDEALRAKMLHDAELMDSMLYKNLVYLREEGRRPVQGVVDLDSVLQTVADQFADIGRNVVYEGGGRQMVRGSLTDLQRIFANLVENAAAHGEQVTLSVERASQGMVRVDVADDGPGIPAEDKARLQEPFMRGRPARNMNEHGGFGLGLSIVGALLEEAGGSLELLDRAPHGLIARVTLRAAPKDRGGG
jgi:signal transduction histidine kinase